MSGRTETAASFDDRAEPGQAKPAGGASEEAPHDGRASGAPPPLSAQGLPKSLGEATGATGRGEAGGQKPSAACNHEFPVWDGMVVDTLPQQRFRRCSLCGRVEVSTSDDEGRTWSEWEEAPDACS